MYKIIYSYLNKTKPLNGPIGAGFLMLMKENSARTDAMKLIELVMGVGEKCSHFS